MRLSSIVVATVASLVFVAPAHAQYEGLSKFHWKRFIDKKEKETAALIAADLAKAGAEYRAAAALAEARLADFQNRVAVVDPIDPVAHAAVLQLSALTVTVTSGAQANRSPDVLETERRRLFAAKVDHEDLTTGSTVVESAVPKFDGQAERRAAMPWAETPRPAEPAPWWTAPIVALLQKLGF